MSTATKPHPTPEARVYNREGTYHVRFPLAMIEGKDSFSLLGEKFQTFDRESVTALGAETEIDLQETSEGLTAIARINPKKGEMQELPMTDYAFGSYLSRFQLYDLKNFAQKSGNRAEAIRILNDALRLALEEKEGRGVRFQTAVEAGQRRIIYTQSARNTELNDLVMLDGVKKIAERWGLQPLKATVTEKAIRISLVTLAKELVMNQVGETGHLIGGQGDRMYPGAEIVISSSSEASRIEGFWFNRLCENGAIFGRHQQFDYLLDKVGENEKILAMMESYFSLVLRKSEQTMGNLGILADTRFDKTQRMLVKSMCNESSLAKVFSDHVSPKFDEIEEAKGNCYQAWNVLTRVSHHKDLAPNQQLNMENVAGKYCYTYHN